MIVSSTRFVRELQKKNEWNKNIYITIRNLYFFVIIYRMTQLVYSDKLRTNVRYVFGEQYYKEANLGFAASCK